MAVLQKNEERLMTGEELARRPDLNPCELVNGRVVPMAPAGLIHGEVEYLAAGVDRIWFVNPRRRSVLVYRSPGQVEALEVGDTLRDEEILPGFALPLSELFQA